MLHLEEVEELATRQAGAQPKGQYVDGVLQPGCMVCRETIPTQQAKFRSKVCANKACFNELRRRRYTLSLYDTTHTFCQVCREEIPQASAKKQATVCGKDCRNVTRVYRLQILKNQKCPHCLHPSSEAEREEFYAWRKSRGGDAQAFRREPHGLALRAALREIVDAIDRCGQDDSTEATRRVEVAIVKARPLLSPPEKIVAAEPAN